MSLAGASEALGLPEALVERSAAARAAETGQSADEILAAWAGGESVAASTAPDPEPAAEPETAVEEEATPDEPVVEIEIPEPAAATTTTSGATTRAPVPAEVTRGEAAHLPEVITVPTAGIKERTNFSIPKWLTALLVVAPFVALFALGGSATGACGEGTELQTDVITGEIVNCDGSEFTGSGAGGGGTDFITLGGELYAGNVTPASSCAGCHGANGAGAGAFPALTGVMTTFGSCADHIEWVLLGSAGWPDDTYGDTNKPVGGGMPAHGALTEEQLAAVVAFERVRFGQADTDEVLVDCGLAEPEGGEGEEGEPGDGENGEEQPAEGEGEDAEASAAVNG